MIGHEFVDKVEGLTPIQTGFKRNKILLSLGLNRGHDQPWVKIIVFKQYVKLYVNIFEGLQDVIVRWRHRTQMVLYHSNIISRVFKIKLDGGNILNMVKQVRKFF